MMTVETTHRMALARGGLDEDFDARGQAIVKYWSLYSGETAKGNECGMGAV